jgi:hypothetical protein
MVLFGALLGLGNPDRKGMVSRTRTRLFYFQVTDVVFQMIAFVFLAEVGFGWAQYLSIAFIQFGVDQVELGISGGLA